MVLPIIKQTWLTFFRRFWILKGIIIAVLVEKCQWFCWMGGFCLLVELHQEGSVPAACAAGLFLSIITALQPWVIVANNIFPFSKRSISWNFSMKSTFLWNFPKSGVQNAIFMRKSHEISLFATVSHGCKGKNILGISWDFPIVFMKTSWLLKTRSYLWIWRKRANFISHSSK